MIDVNLKKRFTVFLKSIRTPSHCFENANLRPNRRPEDFYRAVTTVLNHQTLDAPKVQPLKTKLFAKFLNSAFIHQER